MRSVNELQFTVRTITIHFIMLALVATRAPPSACTITTIADACSAFDQTRCRERLPFSRLHIFLRTAPHRAHRKIREWVCGHGTFLRPLISSRADCAERAPSCSPFSRDSRIAYRGFVAGIESDRAVHSCPRGDQGGSGRRLPVARRSELGSRPDTLCAGSRRSSLPARHRRNSMFSNRTIVFPQR